MKSAIAFGILTIIFVFAIALLYTAYSPVIYETIAETTGKSLLHVYIADPVIEDMQWPFPPVNRTGPPETLPSRNVSRPFEINYAYIELTITKIIFAGAGNESIKEVSIRAKLNLTANGTYILVKENIMIPAGKEIKNIHLLTKDIVIYLEDGSVLATRRETLPIHIKLDTSVSLELGKEYALCIDICFKMPRVIQPPESPYAVVAGSVFATAIIKEVSG